VRRRVLLVAVLVAAAVTVSPAPADAALAQDVSISVRQYRSPTSGAFTLAFSGRIASGAAGESIFLLVKECGYDGFRVVEGTPTTAGGAWSIDTVRVLGAWRARWNDRHSSPVTIRAPIHVSATRVPGRRAWKVAIPRYSGARVYDYQGRIVELQRRTAAGRWVLVRRAQLRATFTAYEAVFQVPTRGLTLRVLVPARTASPCFTANSTAPWRS
jgi:hypothetical protein